MTALRFLCVIPARGGSKGIPGKNIRKLGDRPLISYTIKVARSVFPDEAICLTTDDDRIFEVARDCGLKLPLKRPAELATDESGMYEVLLHVLEHYEKAGLNYDGLVLLQPTSPFRKANQVKEAIDYFSPDLEMVVSVKETKANPYYNLFEENANGFLYPSKPGNFIRRQDCPPVYELNGAIYIINVRALQEKNIRDFTLIRKYEMDEISSLDLDTPLDWAFCEFLMGREYGNNSNE